MKKDFSAVRLCVLVADGVSHLPFDALVREVAAGGADCIQLREKSASDAVLLDRARACRDACDESGRCIFIVNDRPDIAVRSGADGVHIGRADAPAADARRVIGPDRLLGVSAYDLDELAAAEAAGADYTGVGAVYPTATKEIAVTGLDLVRAVSRAATRPFLAIGGIDLSNVRDVILAGAPGVAVFSAIVASKDPRAATREMKEIIASALAR